MMLSAGADDKAACGTAALRQIAKESKLRESSGYTPLAHDTYVLTSRPQVGSTLVHLFHCDSAERLSSHTL